MRLSFDQGRSIMRNDRPCKPAAGTSQVEARTGKTRRFHTGVRRPIIVVACCIVVGWTAWSLWKSWSPVGVPAMKLYCGKVSQRVRAARELMEAGLSEPGRATPPLVAALRDPAAEVRAAAAEALGVVGGEAAKTGSAGEPPRIATSGLIRSLKDREPAVRVAAISALVDLAVTRHGAGSIDLPAMIAALVESLGDQDENVRLVAFNAMARCGPIAPVDPPMGLVAALTDRSSRVKAATVRALANFRCPLDPCVDFLLRGVEGDDREMRSACWAALVRSKPPAFSSAAIPALITALGNGSRTGRFFAARALEPHARDPRVARALIPALLALLRDPVGSGPIDSPGRGPFMAIHAADMLGRIAPGTASAGEVVAALAEAVRTGHPSWYNTAIRALGAFGPAAEPAIPALLQALRQTFARKDGYAFQGDVAVGALTMIAPGTRSANMSFTALIEILQQRPEALEAALARSLLITRLAAIEAVPKFGPMAQRRHPAAPRWRNSADPQLKRAASSALEEIERARPRNGKGDGNASRGRQTP